jgi:hypothetical protein
MGLAYLSYAANGFKWDDLEEGQVILCLIIGIFMLVGIPSLLISVIFDCRNVLKR